MSQAPEHAVQFDRDAVATGLRSFLDLALKQARLDLRYDVRLLDAGADNVEHTEVLVAFSGRDQELLLERNGELLQALEYLAVRYLHMDPKTYDRVRFDSGDYRAMRVEELKLSARVAAERVVASHQPFRLNPMPSRERRVVHLALKDVPGVRTASEGAGDRRQVVIYPAETK
jgi:spoIIIJ-associated protein